MDKLQDTISGINSAATIVKTERSRVPLEFVLDINAYDITDANGVALQTNKINEISSTHHHSDTVSWLSTALFILSCSFSLSNYNIIQSVETICIQLNQPIHDIDVLERWIQTLLWEKTIPRADKQVFEQEEASNDKQITVLRLKGIVTPTGSKERIIIQGVQDLYDMQPAIAADNVEESVGKLVFIGRNLEKSKLEASLTQWLKA